MDRKRLVVLSYHSIDEGFALRLAADLKNAGVRLWMDRLDVLPGDDWQQAWTHAVKESAALLAVLSPEYVAAKPCLLELAQAARRGCLIFSVLLRPLPNAEWPAGTVRQQYVDFSAWPREDVYLERLEALKAILKEEAAVCVGAVPDAETRYLTALAATLVTQQEVAAYLDGLLQTGKPTGEGLIRLPPRPEKDWPEEGLFVVTEGGADDASPFQRTVLKFNGIGGVVEQYPRLVLVGPAGSGKTTVLHHLVEQAIQAYRARPDQAPLPLLLQGVDWGDEASPLELIRGHWPLESDPADALAQGRVALYLDGLSEMGTAAARARLLREWLNGPDAPQVMVMTCRSEDYRGDFVLGLPTVQAAPLDRSDVRRFVARYLDDEVAERVVARIAPDDGTAVVGVPSLQQLVRWPILLNSLVLTCTGAPQEVGPCSVGTLLQELVSVLWARQQSRAEITFEELEAGLSALAFALVDGDKPVYVPYDYAAEYLGSVGLLVNQNSAYFLRGENGYVRFVHHPVRDYFAALHLARQDFSPRVSQPEFGPDGHRVPQKWDGPVVILAGLSPDPDAVVRGVAQVDPYLALACVTGGAHVAENTREEVIAHLVGSAHTEDYDGQLAAACLLAELNDGAAVPLLLEVMRDGSWAARWAATTALRALPLPLLPGLAEALHELDQKQRDATATGLRRLGEAALSTLIQLIRDENWFIRRGAAWALGEVGNAAAVPALVEALHDSENLVSADAAIALGWIRDPVAVPWLRRLLQHENWRVREAGAKALGWIGAPAVREMLAELRDGSDDLRRLVLEALKSTHDHAALEVLLEATYDEDVEIRSAAVEALGNVEGDVFVKRLVECLADTARAMKHKLRICDIAARILEATGKPDLLAVVERWRQDDQSASQAKQRLAQITTARPSEAAQSAPAPRSDSWRQRRDLVLALKKQDAEMALPQLMHALRDEDNQVRIAAVRTLGAFETEAALRALIRALSDDDYLVCDAAADALKDRGTQAVPYLLKALRHSRVNIRGAAIESLGKIADPSTVPELTACLTDVERPWLAKQRICDLAARALEAIGTPEALQAVQQWRGIESAEPDLAVGPTDHAAPDGDGQEGAENHREILMQILANLHHEDWTVREDSAKALREYARLLRGAHDAVILQRLLDTLQDPAWEVRWAVAEALAWIGDESAVPALIDLLNDASWIVRVAVVRALLEIKDVRALPAFIKALADPKDLVREAAAEALGEMGDSSLAPMLTKVMSDREDFVRLAAVQAIGKLKDAATVPTLTRALRDKDDHVRWAAIVALSELANVAAVPALIEGLQYTDGPYWEDKRICDVAAAALEVIGTPEAVVAVEEWRKKQWENRQS